MERDFWIKKWNNNEIGFHLEDINPWLLKSFNQHHLDISSIDTVLVPLCGKTKDMIYFKQHGLKTIGIELSSQAVEDFFKENDLDFTKKDFPQYSLYQSELIDIYCGDIFELDPSLFGKISLIYDRACMVALPVPMRKLYMDWIKSINAETLFIISFVFDNEQVGPPFSVKKEEVRSAYSNYRETFYSCLQADSPQIHQGKITSQADYCLIFQLQ